MKKMMQKKRMAGRLQKPSMPRHTSETNTNFQLLHFSQSGAVLNTEMCIRDSI